MAFCEVIKVRELFRFVMKGEIETVLSPKTLLAGVTVKIVSLMKAETLCCIDPPLTPQKKLTWLAALRLFIDSYSDLFFPVSPVPELYIPCYLTV